MNKQIPVKQDLKRDGVNRLFEITEIFYTIQGEGIYAGDPAVFIRMAGCNLQCTWCDTEYDTRQELSIVEIIHQVERSHPEHMRPLVVLTGGEPFRQNIGYLCSALIRSGYYIQVETNGVLSLPYFPWDNVRITCGPKAGKIHPDIINHCSDFKYVIGAEDKDSYTGLPIASTQGAGKPPPEILSSRPQLTPRDDNDVEKNKANMETAVYLCKKFGHRLNIQVHKVAGIP